MSDEVIKEKPSLEIKRCPFCLGAKCTLGYSGQPAICGFVQCLSCGSQGPEIASLEATGGKLDWEAAVTAWNERPSL